MRPPRFTLPALPLRFRTLLLAAGLMYGCVGTTPARTPERAPAISFVPFSPGHAAPARRAKLDAVTPALDALFAAKMKESGATGFAVGVILDGELAYQRGFGVRDLASHAPVDGPDGQAERVRRRRSGMAGLCCYYSPQTSGRSV